MTFVDQKRDFICDVNRDVVLWRAIMLPQMFFILLTAVLLAILTLFGLYVAITTFKSDTDPSLLTKVIPVFIGGSSSVLGFVVFKLLTTLDRLTHKFMAGEKRFTSFCARANHADNLADFLKVLKEYGQD